MKPLQPIELRPVITPLAYFVVVVSPSYDIFNHFLLGLLEIRTLFIQILKNTL